MITALISLISVLFAGTLILFVAQLSIRQSRWRASAAWLLVFVILSIGWLIAHDVNPYLRMVVTWVCMFLAFKTVRLMLTPQSALRDLTFPRFVGFMLWLGMDTEPWTRARSHVPHTMRRLHEGLILAGVGFGLMLVFLWVPLTGDWWRLVRAWCAWVALVIGLFFGVTRIWLVVVNAAGRDVALLFDRPVYARTVSEWWSRRWNMPVHMVFGQAIFQPLRRRFGISGASMAVFLVSGIMHEYLLSYPASGGWGLPTLYFVVQAIGTRMEQSRRFRRWLRAAWWRGSLWTFGVTLIPAPLLFHPALLQAVVMPLLRG